MKPLLGFGTAAAIGSIGWLPEGQLLGWMLLFAVFVWMVRAAE